MKCPLKPSLGSQSACRVTYNRYPQTGLTLLQDEDKLQRAHNEVPTNDELNQRLARSEAELAIFRAIDAEMDSASVPMGKYLLQLPSCAEPG